MTANNEWDGWPPYELWKQADHERSIITWLMRRVDKASMSGVIRLHVGAFKHMWVEQFGTDTEIPQDVKDRVNAKLAELKAKELADK